MSTFAIYANKQELEHLPEEAQYLFRNFSWKTHPAYLHCVELSFPEDDEGQLEAYGVYHELWKYRFDLPSLTRSWI